MRSRCAAVGAVVVSLAAFGLAVARPAAAQTPRYWPDVQTSGVQVAGSYQPFVGDFNGDGYTDIFWYAPGNAHDSLWFGRADGHFANDPRAPQVAGKYLPIVGDFLGGRPDDVLWEPTSSQAGPASLWHMGANGHPVARMPLARDSGATPVVVPGGAHHDSVVFWHRSAASSYLTFDATDHARRGSLSISSTQPPVAGDFNGDGRGDLFWPRPGAAVDYVTHHLDDHPTTTPFQINVTGTYEVASLDFDGDGSSDLFFNSPTRQGSAFAWYGQTDGQFRSTYAYEGTPLEPWAILHSGPAGTSAEILVGDKLYIEDAGHHGNAPTENFTLGPPPSAFGALHGRFHKGTHDDVFVSRPGATTDTLYLSPTA